MTVFPRFLEVWFWIPLPLTLGFAAWCWFFTYPAFLEARIKDTRNPKPWIYLPSWWKGPIARWASPVSWGLLLLTAYAWTGASRRFLPPDAPWAVLPVFAASLALLVSLRHILIRENFLLQRECYFRDYKRLAYEALSKGKSPSETELRNLCMWEHQQALRRAEQSGRLNQYLRVKAKSRKPVGAEHEQSDAI